MFVEGHGEVMLQSDCLDALKLSKWTLIDASLVSLKFYQRRKLWTQTIHLGWNSCKYQLLTSY